MNIEENYYKNKLEHIEKELSKPLLPEEQLEKLRSIYSEEDYMLILSQLKAMEQFIRDNQNQYAFSLDFRTCTDKIIVSIIKGKFLKNNV